jgi:hypothetical protein
MKKKKHKAKWVCVREREAETEVLGWFDFLLERICTYPPHHPHHICELHRLMDGVY